MSAAFHHTWVNPGTAVCEHGEGPGCGCQPPRSKGWEVAGKSHPQEKLLEARPRFSAEAVTVGEAAAAACGLLFTRQKAPCAKSA